MACVASLAGVVWQSEAQAFFTLNGTNKVGNFVWDDANRNGVQDNGELGINGITVSLYDGTTRLASTITGASPLDGSAGYYEFSGIPANTTARILLDEAADYLISGPLIGRGLTLAGQGADPAKDSNATQPGMGWVTIENVTTGSAGAVDANYDIGFYPAATIGDYVWADANRNGIQDSGESGINGVMVHIYKADGGSVGEMLTADNPADPSKKGFYYFDGLDPATNYRVALDRAADRTSGGPLYQMALTTKNAVLGTASTDSDAQYDSQNPSIMAALTGPGYSFVRDWDFGFTPGDIDLSLTQVAAPVAPATGSPYLANDTVRFTVTVSANNSCGPTTCTTASGVSVTDLLPSGYTFVSASAGGVWSSSARTVTWSALSLTPGSTVNLTIDATVLNPVVPVADQWSNYAQITAAAQPDVDSDPNDNSGPISAASEVDATKRSGSDAHDDEAMATIAGSTGNSSTTTTSSTTTSSTTTSSTTTSSSTTSSTTTTSTVPPSSSSTSTSTSTSSSTSTSTSTVPPTSTSTIPPTSSTSTIPPTSTTTTVPASSSTTTTVPASSTTTTTPNSATTTALTTATTTVPVVTTTTVASPVGPVISVPAPAATSTVPTTTKLPAVTTSTTPNPFANPSPTVPPVVSVPPASPAGSVPSVQAPADHTVAGLVWYDRNRNGVRETTERGIAGVEIRVSGNESGPWTSVTAADGTYRITNLPLGTYTVSARTVDVPTNGDNDRPVAIIAGQNDPVQDFGYANAKVLGITSERDPQAAADLADLALTGTQSTVLVAAALMLLGAGGLLTARRKTRKR